MGLSGGGGGGGGGVGVLPFMSYISMWVGGGKGYGFENY